MIVSNSSPLIMAAKIDRFDLLSSVFPEGIVIPEMVYNEITSSDKPGSLEVQSADFINVKICTNQAHAYGLNKKLDAGESEAIALAHELGAKIILMDDHVARAMAISLALKPIGIIGILILAKDLGFIDLLKPELNKLIANGFWLSNNLIDIVLNRVGEK